MMLKNMIKGHWEKLVIVSLPFLLSVVNPIWLLNKSDIDWWFYYGYFRDFLDYWGTYSPSEAHLYYGTRIAYTGLGHLVYSIFDSPTARYIFNLLFLHAGMVFPFWYVARAHVSRGAAFAITVMFAADIFFIRMVGNDYVDNGVVLYQLASFFFLTVAIKSKKPAIALVAAGFSAMSMISVHLLSGIFLPLFPCYYAFFRSKEFGDEKIMKGLFAACSWMSLGAVICILVYGTFFKLYANGPFLFFLPQIRILSIAPISDFTMNIDYLITEGYWLTIHLAMSVASIVALVFVYARKRTVTHRSLFFLVAFPAICALLALFKPDGLWFLISREGAYATFFFPMTYLAFGMLLFQDDKSLDMLHAGIVALFFLASLAIRLRFGGAAAWQGIPMFMVALFISIVISIGFLFGPDKKISTTVACVAGLATIMIPWKFDGNPSVLEAHEVISKYNRGRLPKIFWPKSQIRTKGPTFELITASFTERAWWQRGEKFPDCHQTDGGQIDHDDLLVFLSRETITADELSRFKECSGDFHVLGSTILKDRIGNYQLVLAEMPLDGEIVVLNKHARDLLSETGVIQGTFRYAEDKTSSEGFLSHGPYLSLSKGKYRLTLTYASDMNLNWWDAVFYKKNKWIQMGKNILPNTNGRPEDISVEIEIADAVKPFEVRSYYSGHGRFEVHKLSIVKLGI